MISRRLIGRQGVLWYGKQRLHSSGKKHEEATIPNLWRHNNPVQVALGVIATCFVGVSIYIRRWRADQLDRMEPMTELPPGREDLLELMERTGQMGKSGAKSVKAELEDIRQWHTNHGYKGGLVLRELTQPLFIESSGIIEGLEELALDPMQLARRECYYLYYEITGNGEIKQQIFCRGTTLLVDVLTCLAFWMVHDNELGCRVHLGFRNQADRILQDIEPLLAPASDKRITVEVSGHSLGGAVAYIMAGKLRKRGYRVTRTTAVAAPRFCASRSSAQAMEALLPAENLRIESDIDFVPFLPPFACHTGNKLYLVDAKTNMYYASASPATVAWLDSVFLNFRSLEILLAMGKSHRMPHHVAHVRKVLGMGF